MMQLLEGPIALELAVFWFEKYEQVTPGMVRRLLASNTEQ